MDMSAPPAVRLENLTRVYWQGERQIVVLNGAEAQVMPGEVVALVAPSGAGKSSLLHILGLLEKPNAGSVFIGERNCTELSDSERTIIRRRDLGFIYQFHHLLPEFSALENVAMPQMILGFSGKQARAAAADLLSELGLAERLDHRPGELSGGEQQRVAIARAVINKPKLLLADEPTGNLDPGTSERVFAQLLKLVRETGLASIIATHNLELAGQMDRVIALKNGKLTEGLTVI